MPSRAHRPCSKPGCRALVVPPRSYCDEHQREYNARRPTPAARGYDAAWRKLRARVLREEPICGECRERSSTHVDHIVAQAKGGTNERANLRGLCAGCHSRKTVSMDHGFGRAPLPATSPEAIGARRIRDSEGDASS